MAAHSTKPIRPALLVLAVSLLAALLLAVPPASARMAGAIGASGEHEDPDVHAHALRGQALDGVDIGLIGAPFDGGVTNRTGVRHGPREIRNQSSLMRRINRSHHFARISSFGPSTSVWRRSVKRP